MKRELLLLFLLCLSLVGRGQTDTSSAPRFDTTGYLQFLQSNVYTESPDSSVDAVGQLNHMLSGLDMSRVPYGVLYNKSISVSDIANQTGADFRMPVTPIQIHQAYHEYYNSIVGDTRNNINPDELAALIATEFSGNIHPLLILSVNMSMIDTDAVDNNLLILDDRGVLRDNPQAPRSPYVPINATMASIASSSFIFDTGTHYITLDPRFILGNNPLSIRSIQLDFNNSSQSAFFDINGMSPSDYGSLPPAQFIIGPDDSNIVVSVTITPTEGAAVHRRFKVANKLHPPDQLDPNIGLGVSSPLSCDETDGVTGYTPAQSIFNDYGAGTAAPATGHYTIFYSDADCATRRLSKPVIFLDGFDPGNSRSISDIYNNYINKGVHLNGSAGIAYLADKIRADGYDLIIVDYDNGGDYIEKNGLLLAKTINDLYSRFSSTLVDDFVVIGPSYGALVGQYGLSWMEKNGMPTHTRLFISFDGPHQGANVAIGMQNFVDYVGSNGILGALASAGILDIKSSTIDNVAARQMIIHSYSSGSESAPAPHNFRNIFLNHLSAVNWWPSCRRVAVINGNRQGNQNPIVNPEDGLLSVTHKIPLIFNWTLTDIDWNSYATSKWSRDKDMHMYTSFMTALASHVNVGWTNKYHTPGASHNTALDVCPGSYFNGLEKYHLDSDFMNFLYGLTWTSASKGKVDNTTFIPTISSSDYYPSPEGFYPDKSFNNQIISACANNTSFAWVYANTYNTNHVDVDDNIGSWFYNEIERKTQDLGTYNNYISGPDHICPGSTATFSISIPASGSVAWTVPGGFSVISGAGTSTIIIKNVSATAMSSVLTAKFKPSCADAATSSTLTLQKTITTTAALAPGVSYSRSGPTAGHYTHTVTVNSPDPSVSYSGYMGPVGGGAGTISFTGTSHSYTSGSASIWWQVCSSNGCGGDCTANHTLYRNGDSSSAITALEATTLYPNPAQDKITVELGSGYTEKAQLVIMALDGKRMMSSDIQPGSKNIMLGISALTPGIYIVEISSGGKTEHLKFVKN